MTTERPENYESSTVDEAIEGERAATRPAVEYTPEELAKRAEEDRETQAWLKGAGWAPAESGGQPS